MTLADYHQFAKHFKVEEQVAFLQKNRSGMAVGTPQRLVDLIENGRYSSSNSYVLMLTVQKGRSLLRISKG